MARSPLWLALSVLAAVRLAGAAELASPVERSPAPIPGAGVSMVPALTAGLSSPLAGLGPVIAAPSAFPAPLPAAFVASPSLVPALPAGAADAPAARPAARPADEAASRTADGLIGPAGKLDVAGREPAQVSGLGSAKLAEMFDGAAAGRAADVDAPKTSARALDFEVSPGKWDYFFGRVKARLTEGMSAADAKKQAHNQARSAQIARILSENGIKDDAGGRERLMKLFRDAASAPTFREVKTEHGVGLIKLAELPTATLEISFYYPKDSSGRVDFRRPASVTTIIPKEH